MLDSQSRKLDMKMDLRSGPGPRPARHSKTARECACDGQSENHRYPKPMHSTLRE